ncbi:PREDICTED: uncharacterized protein LOC104590543 [Nelumbo nucifera]|uniref:Uncharacterized protein LOC104590543 n=1 Tax=Nelumbo nucifera TaxID=4432 RepID=A0A1U7ZIL4_NELNU|nr:PREDICTED: uncharacterized protein LOC104590543 [Nelumbo nucifera]
MQRSSVLSPSPTSFSPFYPLPSRQAVEVLFRNRCRSSTKSYPWTKLQSSCSFSYRNTIPVQRSTAIEEAVETSSDESKFIEIGYISTVHGIQGELRVKPTTDFPELRFATPGSRWLRDRVSGKERIREVELVEGRGHHGQKGWIVSFDGIDTVEEARQLVGSTILVREEDRPVLDEGEFYTPDLVGMRVILKDTNEAVGTVIDVFNSGAGDLLQVMLNPSEGMVGTGLSKSETGISGRLVWVPFVEAIVPDVDMTRREMHITPPKGLLELNLRSDMRSKKERRKLEWKQRKKFQQRLIAAKKKLCEMEQKHLFEGFRFGEKEQRSMLADQIVTVNSSLLQLALQNTQMHTERWDLSNFISAKQLKRPFSISKECLTPRGSKEKLDRNHELQRAGVRLLSEGKHAVVVVVSGSNSQEDGSIPKNVDSESEENSSNASLLQELLHDDERFAKIKEEHVSVPLVIVSPSQEIQSLKKPFLDHDYFSLDSEKVWFLEEERLPILSSSSEEKKRHKILLKSPWEILQSPVGSGGVFSLLSSHNILENFSEMGVEYVQVCSLVQQSVLGHPLFFGLVDSCKADIGIRIFNSGKDGREDFDMIFSMRFLEKITRQLDKLQFYTVAKQNSHVEKVEKEWVDIVPDSPNSYEFHCSIYSSLNACSADKICLMELTD